MSKVVSLQAFREVKKALIEDSEYNARILEMDRNLLLKEMVRFQEERTVKGHLTLPMIVRGKMLFKALGDIAETQELRLLSRSYLSHLEFELSLLKNNYVETVSK